MKRHILALILALTLCLLMITKAIATSGEDKYFISKTLLANSQIFSRYNSKGVGESSVDDVASISISDDKSVASIVLAYNGVQYSVDLHGEATKVSDGELVGFVGVYEGFLPSKELGNQNTYIIADVIFSNSHIFVAFSIGTVTSSSEPIIVFYGTLTEDLLKISNTYVERMMKSPRDASIYNDPTGLLYQANEKLSVDAVIRFQGQSTIAGGDNKEYEFGCISVYHPNELRVQGITNVQVKVNSNTSNVLYYLREDLGYKLMNYNVYSVNPDKFYISLCSQYPHLILTTNGYFPQNSQTNFSMFVPYVTVSNIGVPSISVTELDIITSTTKATASAGSSGTSLIKVDWELASTFGFNSSMYDGNSQTETGMIVSAGYTYADNFSSPLNTSFLTTARIRYQYFVQVSGTDSIVLHMTTETKSLRSSVKLLPE